MKPKSLYCMSELKRGGNAQVDNQPDDLTRCSVLLHNAVGYMQEQGMTTNEICEYLDCSESELERLMSL